MASQPLIRATGLQTDPNPFLLSDGALSVALNIIIQRAGLIQSRRGWAWQQWVTGGVVTYKLFSFGGNLLSCITGTLRYTAATGTAWTTLTGTYTTPNSYSYRPMMAIANKNAYLTFAEGLYRLTAASATPAIAGAPTPLGIDRKGPTNLLTGSSGFLLDQYQVAYRVVLAYTDANGTTHRSAPSGRTIVANANGTSGWSTGVSKNVVCRVLLPSGLTRDWFFQIYRSNAIALSTDGSTPSDDLQLVYEQWLKDGDITNGYVDVTDVYSEVVPKGAYLYCSPNNAEAGAIGQTDGENSLPPAAYDVAQYKERLWLANSVGLQRFTFNILAVGGSDGIQDGDIIYFNGAQATFGLFAKTTPTTTSHYKLETGYASAAQNIEQTAINLCDAINKFAVANGHTIRAYYGAGQNDIPGRIVLEGSNRSLSAAAIVTYVLGPGKRTCFSPVLPVVSSSNFDLSRTGYTVTATGNPSTTVTYLVGERVYVHTNGVNGLTDGWFVITSVGSNTFTYTDTASGTATLNNVVTGIDMTVGTSTADAWPHALHFSKHQQPEAFPLKNLIFVGSGDQPILRILALKQALIILKQDGVYRLTGESPSDFVIKKVSSARCLARETAQVLSNAVYVWTDLGVAKITEDGFQIISKRIEKTLLDIRATSTSAIATYAFAVAYETDGLYIMWYPSASNLATCDYALVYCAASDAWVQWHHQTGNNNSNRFNCGVVLVDSSNEPWLCFGTYDPSSGTALFKERRARANSDYEDDRTVPIGGNPMVTQVGIQRQARYVVLGGDSPGLLKRYSEACTIWEQANPAFSVTYYDAAGSSAGANSYAASYGSLVVRDWIPRGASLGTMLSVSIAASTVQQPFDLIGLVVQREVLGAAAVR